MVADTYLPDWKRKQKSHLGFSARNGSKDVTLGLVAVSRCPAVTAIGSKTAAMCSSAATVSPTATRPGFALRLEQSGLGLDLQDTLVRDR